MARPRTPIEEKRRKNRERGRAWRAKTPLTPEQKAKKAQYTKRYQQTPAYKAWAAAKYRARREALASHPRPDLCEVCGKPPNGKGALHFDHCHTTQIFRGWLCHTCNVVLGNAEDDPVLLRKLADYLERFPRPEGPYQPKSRATDEKPQAPSLPLFD
jgi:hypothetical protein